MAKVIKPVRAKSGAEMDPATVDALASEAERGYDLAGARRRRVGRPSLAGRGPSPRVSFRTTPELYRAAQRRAKQEGRSVSELAREAVARYVNPAGATDSPDEAPRS
jgi:predicted HicB family RNase H-like nuclease